MYHRRLVTNPLSELLLARKDGGQAVRGWCHGVWATLDRSKVDHGLPDTAQCRFGVPRRLLTAPSVDQKLHRASD